jgi:hypothetical protein
MAVTDAYKHVFNDVTAFPKNITIDLVARYAAAFGMMAAGKAIDKVFIDKTENKDYNFQYYPLAQDDLEYTQFQIPGLEALTFNSVLAVNGDVIFAPPLLMGFSQEKSLIETEVNDDDPIIVERWGTKPWDITINGLLIDLKNRIYPTDEIRRLNKNWQYNGVIKVVGKQFEELDIDSIYFRSISFTRTEGYSDTVQFSINASSIKAVNFTLLKPNS